jgi:hypothetical protein
MERRLASFLLLPVIVRILWFLIITNIAMPISMALSIPGLPLPSVPLINVEKEQVTRHREVLSLSVHPGVIWNVSAYNNRQIIIS